MLCCLCTHNECDILHFVNATFDFGKPNGVLSKIDTNIGLMFYIMNQAFVSTITFLSILFCDILITFIKITQNK